MTEWEITTVNTFDEQGIFPLRTVRAGTKTIQTPAVATQPGKLRDHESFHPQSRLINELYRTVSGTDLDEAMRRSGGGTINDDLRRQFDKTEDDELTITFTKFDESSTLSPAHAQYLVDLHARYSDAIAAPLFTKLVRGIDPDNGLSDPAYRSLKKSIVAFLNQAQQRHTDMPLMGLIPRLGWVFIDDLMEVYAAHGVRAYVFDFDRRKITTGTQVAMISPLMANLANRGIEDNVLMYAINLSPGGFDHDVGARPAADMAAVGLGFDIIGGNHISPNRPAEVYEDMEDESDAPTFRLFDRDRWIREELELDTLLARFPEDSAFDPQAVVDRVRQSPKNAKYRLQHLVNGEQMALAASDLRHELEDGDAYSSVESKLGVTGQVTDAYEEVRAAFDNIRFQSGLGEFS